MCLPLTLVILQIIGRPSVLQQDERVAPEEEVLHPGVTRPSPSSDCGIFVNPR
jgi:hypothetical protein